jgi:hypothetical protein
MKAISLFVVLTAMAVSVFSVVGCSSSNQPAADQGSTAGGNGAFGESPARPGSHEGDRYNQEGAGAPATQPSGS